MRYKLVIVLACILSVHTLYAQDTSLRVLQLDEQLSPLINERDAFFVSPSLRPYYRMQSFTNLAAKYNHSKSDLYRPQMGSGGNSLKIYSESFLKKTEGLSLWGKAYYTNEHIANINYNESQDFNLIYPYVMADTVGGDLKSETYYFQGGLAQKLGKLSLGLEVDFKGTQSYRDVDPRPKNISSDINLKASVGKNIGKNYMISLDLLTKKYNQDNELEFANALGFPLVFHLSGLGVYNELLAGKRTDAYFKGQQYGAQLNLAQVKGEGFFAQIGFNQLTVEKRLSSIYMPISDLSENQINSVLGYQINNGASQWLFKLNGNYTKRNGTEAKFGYVDTEFSLVKISEDLRYIRENLSADLDLIYGKKAKYMNWFAALNVGYNQSNESYLSPNRFLNNEHLTIGTSLNASKHFQKTTFSLSFKLAKKLPLQNSFNWTDLNVNRSIYSMLSQDFNYLSTEALYVTSGIRLDTELSSKLNLFVKSSYRYTDFSEHHKAHQVIVSAGFLF